MFYKYNIMNHSSQAQSIGQALRQQRKLMGYTQDQVAQSLNVRRQTIADLENGKNVGSHLLLGTLSYLGLNFQASPTKLYQESIDRQSSLVKESQQSLQISNEFDFPYDWSNPGGMSDDVLIMKVLKRLRFADIVRLCKRFGVDRIDQEIKSNFYDDVRDDLSEVMETIHEALARKVT